MLPGRKTALALTFLATAMASAAPGTVPGDALVEGFKPKVRLEHTEHGTPVLYVTSRDPKMRQAFTDARTYLRSALGGQQKSDDWFSPSLSMLVAMRVQGSPDEIELLWLRNIRRSGIGFLGRLGGQSEQSPGRFPGSLIRFEHSQIADWSVQAVDGRYYGFFTTRALLDDLPKEQADAIRAILVERPLPPFWK